MPVKVRGGVRLMQRYTRSRQCSVYQGFLCDLDIRFSVLQLSDCILHVRQSLFQLRTVKLFLSVFRHSRCWRCRQLTNAVLLRGCSWRNSSWTDHKQLAHHSAHYICRRTDDAAEQHSHVRIIQKSYTNENAMFQTHSQNEWQQKDETICFISVYNVSIVSLNFIHIDNNTFILLYTSVQQQSWHKREQI